MLSLSDDQELQNHIKLIHRGVQVKEDEDNHDLHLKTKLRLIDPSVLHKNRLIRASILSENVNRMSIEAKKKAENGMYVKIIIN